MRNIVLPTCTLAGAVGSAVGTVTTYEPVVGSVVGVQVTYTGGTSTENLVVSTLAGSQTVLQLYGNATSGWWYPRVQTHSYGGTALEFAVGYAQTIPLPVLDYVRAVVSSGGTPGNTVDVTLLVDG